MNPDDWGGARSTGGWGDPLTFALRLGLAAAITCMFLRWQFAHADDPPVPPLIADLESGRKRIPCLLFNRLNPNSRCLGISLPIPVSLSPDRPCEYMSTGIWQGAGRGSCPSSVCALFCTLLRSYCELTCMRVLRRLHAGFVFTWPYAPRFFEPQLTEVGRLTVTVLVLVVQLATFIVLGKANTTITDIVAEDGISLSAALAMASIYMVSIVGAVMHEILVFCYALAYRRGGMIEKGVFFSTGGLLGLVIVAMSTTLTHLACKTFVMSAVLPFLMKQPLALISAPVIYSLKNSFGQGPGVEGILELYKVLPTTQRCLRHPPP